MILCDFLDGVCRHCHRPSPAPAKTVVRECLACRHLGEPVRSVRLACGRRRPVEASAAICRRWGRCLPVYKPCEADAWGQQPEASLYHLCHDCSSFSPQRDATSDDAAQAP